MKKTKPGSGEELSALIPGETRMTVKVRKADGQYEEVEVRIGELDITQIARVGEALAPIHADVQASPNLLMIAAKHPAEIFAAVAIAIDWPAKRVAVMQGGHFLMVATAIIGRNADFFSQLLALQGSADPAIPPTKAAGGEPRSSSSGPVASPIPNGSPSASSSLQ